LRSVNFLLSCCEQIPATPSSIFKATCLSFKNVYALHSDAINFDPLPQVITAKVMSRLEGELKGKDTPHQRNMRFE